MGPAIVLVGLCVSCTWGSALDKAAQEAVVLKEGLLLDRVGQYGTRAVYTDPLVSEIIHGRWTAPQAGQKVQDPDGRAVAWQAVQANDKGWFEGPGQSGYLYLTIPCDQPRCVLLNVMGPGMLYVNGEPRVGSCYASKDQYESWETNFNMTFLPVRLQVGTNGLLVQRAWRSGGRVKVAVLESPPLALNPRDTTVPDLAIGQDVNAVGGVVVINASEQPCVDLALEMRWPSGATERTTVPRIEALSLRKVSFPLRHPRFERAGSVACQLDLLRGQEHLDSMALQLEVKSAEQPQMRTFVSDIDGSVQYYALREALPRPGQAGVPALVLSVHGAGVQALGQAAAYASKSWCHIVSPTNRRPYGFDWEDWGRLDSLEVLDQVKRSLAFDPSRVYLTGHSMGGHGTWILGSTYPDRFAAIGPSAGWISFWSYRGAQRPETLGPVAKVLLRAETPSDTIRLSPNLRDTGVYILHGGADDVVRPDQARQMVDHLQTFHHDWIYHEEPGQGHWWDLSEDEPGADCVDWAPMFDFFARHRLPGPEEVRQVSFTTANPGVSAWCHWVGIEAQQVPLALSRVDLRFYPGRQGVAGTTENVSRLCLRLKGMVPDTGAHLRVEIDGQRLDGICPTPATCQVWLRRNGSQWQVVERPSPGLKGPHRYGPFKDAFRHRMVFVYGTAGSPQETAWAWAKARFDAELWWYQGNGAVDVLPDAAFDPAAEPDRGVILYGNADTHRSWQALLGDSPVQVTRRRVTCGERSVEAPDLACLFLRPRRGSDVACVGVVSGTGLAGLRLTDRFTYLQAGSSFPDCTIVSSRMLTEGLGGVEAAGFFGEDWSVEKGDFAWAGAEAEAPKDRALPADVGPDPRGYVHPRGYVCHRTTAPLEIDGRLDELAWTQAAWTEPFVDIQGTRGAPTPRFETRAKMLWDDKCLYIGAVLEDPHVWATLTERNAVIFNDNDFEVFLDPDGDSHRYFEFEMNALNTVWNLFLDRPYKHGGTARVREMPGQRSAVFVKGTLNDPCDTDQYWSVEIAMPFEAMAEHARCACPPRDGDQWRIDFSRVEWHHQVREGLYDRVPARGSELKEGSREDNWVWSAQGAVNMHRPETWGYVQFSAEPVGEEVPFRPDPLAPARYLLHRVLYAQQAHLAQKGSYATSLSALGLEDLWHPSLNGPIRLTGEGQTYTVEAQVRLDAGRTEILRLHQDGWLERTEAVKDRKESAQ